MQIETANLSEFAEIAHLMNSAYRGQSSRMGWTTEADYFLGERTTPQSLASDVQAGPGRLMLAMRSGDNKKIIGCVFLETGCGPDGLGCYLGMLTIDPTLQAGGLGRTLLSAAEQKAMELGASRMILGVLSPREELMSWYERRGYLRTGETKPYPYEKFSEIEKPTREDLHFIFLEKSF